MIPRPLSRAFFSRPPAQVAVELLGKTLVRQLGRRTLRARIVETEAYLGEGDLAAHVARGRRLSTEVLFGPPGHAYIYISYGLHFCLNVSTQPAGQAGCVLFRALEPISGAPAMLELAPTERAERVLSGPGRLTRALALTRALNGHDMTRRGALYIAEAGTQPLAIAVTRRIGITKSVELPLRFYVETSRAVTSPRRPVLRNLVLPV